MARHAALPPTLPPRLISREAAAAYLSVAPGTFDKMVEVGRMPRAKRLWVQCLAKKRAGVNAYRVALYLLHEAWRTNNPKVKLTNEALAESGVKRKGKATALRQLRTAGLISVVERIKRSPIVTVRFLEQ